MATAKTAKDKVEDVTATATISRLTSTYKDVSENLKDYGSSASKIGTVATQSVRNSFNGFMTFERAFFNVLRANLDTTVEHGRDILKSPNVAEIARKQAAFLNAQAATISGQIKDLSDVAEEQSKVALEPFTTYVATIGADTSK